jgi:hypothetical protein
LSRVPDLFAAVCSIAPTRRRRFMWAAWWSGPPTRAPFRSPDAHGGGARTAEEALSDAQAATGRSLVGIEARWARAWANILAGRPPWRSTSVGERVDGARAASVAPARRDETPRSAWMVLGVPRDATAADIKRAFRRRALETHPDRGGDAEAFQAVHRAYERALARAERPRRRRRR